MDIYKKLYQSEYLAHLYVRKENDTALEESLVKHQETFTDEIFALSNKDFYKTIKLARRHGIARYHDKPGGIFKVMFKQIMKGLFTNKKVLWIMTD